MSRKMTSAYELEKDLVEQCRQRAEDMGCWVAFVGQRKAKGSGTTVGYPDMTLFCNGWVVLIELKRTKTADGQAGTLNLGQIAFIEKAAGQAVRIPVIDSVDDLTAVINECRRHSPRGVVRR